MDLLARSDDAVALLAAAGADAPTPSAEETDAILAAVRDSASD